MAAAGSRCCEPQLSGASAMQQLACRGTSEPRCPGGWGPRSRILACQPMQERCQRWWEAGWELQAAAGARLGCVRPWTRGELCDQAPEDLGSGARGWGRRMLRPDCPPWHSTQRTEGPRSEQPFSARQPNCLCSSNQYPCRRPQHLPPTHPNPAQPSRPGARQRRFPWRRRSRQMRPQPAAGACRRPAPGSGAPSTSMRSGSATVSWAGRWLPRPAGLNVHDGRCASVGVLYARCWVGGTPGSTAPSPLRPYLSLHHVI